MARIAWRMLLHRPLRLWVTWGGLGGLFFLATTQLGLLVGWCNTVSAIIRHTDADLWVMAERTRAFDYGTAIPRRRVFQVRSVEGVAWAEGMFVGWSVWQRPDGSCVQVSVVGLDGGCEGGPWLMEAGDRADCVRLPDGVICDRMFADRLGVRRVGDEAEMLGHRAVVRGISKEVRTFTALPFVFASLGAARRFDQRYRDDDITYVLVRCRPSCSPEAVRQRLGAEVPHVEVLTRREFAVRTMRYWMLETGAGLTVVLAACLGLAVSVVVTSQTLFAVTQEYLPNYATLAAVGFGRAQLLACVLLQGLALAAGEVLLGSAGFAAAARLSARTNLPFETTPWVYAGLVLVAMGSCLVGGFLSVRTVLRVDPATVYRG
jgi:putative ABC transport system permease protein